MSLTFQIVGATSADRYENGIPSYVITLFGVTSDTGKSVSVDVVGFKPFFFVQIPDSWSSHELNLFKDFLTREVTIASENKTKTKLKTKSKIEEDTRIADTLQLKTVMRESFWEFANNQEFPFLLIEAKSKRIWTLARNVLLDPERMTPIPYSYMIGKEKQTINLQVFEANFDPMLRFFHIRELKPAGWATIEDGRWDEIESDDQRTSAVIQAVCEWEDIQPASALIQLTTAHHRIMSWDIECNSSHGDFPQAYKKWRKPALELVTLGITDGSVMAELITDAILRTSDPNPSSSCGVDDEDENEKLYISRIYLSQDSISKVGTKIEEVSRAWITSGVAHAIQTKADDAVDQAENLLNFYFPELLGDEIIQIGSVITVGGVIQRKDIFVLGSCVPVAGENVYTYPCRTEADVIKKWCAFVREQDPDIMIGYNIFGFDDKYIWDRATVNNCQKELQVFNRYPGTDPKLEEKNLCSSAMGDNKFYVISGGGRLHIDLLVYIRRNAVLPSYKLDYVTSEFMSGNVLGISLSNENAGAGAVAVAGSGVTESHETFCTIKTKSTKGTLPGHYIVLLDEDKDVIGDKLEVVSVTSKSLTVRMLDDGEALRENGIPPCRWSQSKDDISPKDIFRLHREGPAGRSKVAKYCLQDCALVFELMQKLEVLNNSTAMANVCWVPVDYIFTRGQGIKSESLVFYECRKKNKLIPVLPSPPKLNDEEAVPDGAEGALNMRSDDIEGYEGAIVLEPLRGIYLDDDPVAALDFSSLYPSTIISENFSHDSLVWVKDYNRFGEFVKIKEGSEKYDNLLEWNYLEVEYDILRPDPKQAHKKHPEMIADGKRVCRYAQPPDGTKSTLPAILMMLLKQRKLTRNQAAEEKDEFRAALLDAQQLAYKLTANSLYGQLGSNTSKIRRKVIAASTTAHGRQQLLFSKACIETAYGSDAKDPRCSAVCVYGDTDSVFIAFRPCDPVTGERLRGKAAQKVAKELAEEAGHKISGALKPPHDFEFDKMFRCFCLLSKKRYVGDMTEGGLEDDDYHRKSMGIVMKRRDNAPIVKYVYGGVIEEILVNRDIRAAFEFVRKTVKELLAGKFGLKRLTITKSLRSEYKAVPAHKILADRIGKRDPGNKPASNDRIPFVYIAPPRGTKPPDNQGDRIETPSYILEKNLKPDYIFYITNQIAKPVSQVFGLVVEQLPGVKKSQLDSIKRAKDPIAAREELAEELLFGDMIADARREAAGIADLRSFFTKR